ncbi:MAG: hypothetical protein Q4C49_14500 [Bacillota bacterium]|nr:hypothetical protein [Bacillota bacterium]
MKKLLSLFCAFSMFFLVACGKDLSNSNYCGTWVGTTVVYGDYELSVESIYGKFELNLDGKGKATITTSEEEKSGKWDETETGVSLDNGDVILTEKDGNLVLEEDGMQIIFVKK